MVVYTLYVWLRRPRHGTLEAQRKRACLVMLTVLSGIFLQSGHHAIAVDAWVQVTEAAAANTRSLAARLARPVYAVAP